MDDIIPKLGAPDQLGFVTGDMDASIETFSKLYDFEKTMRFDFETEDHWVRGELFPIKLDIFIGVVDRVEYEIIQPLSDGPHKWFLDKIGGGLQHIGYNVSDYDRCEQKMQNAGFNILMQVKEMDVYEPGASEPDHRLVAAYFEKPSMGNLLIEIAARSPYQKHQS